MDGAGDDDDGGDDAAVQPQFGRVREQASLQVPRNRTA